MDRLERISYFCTYIGRVVQIEDARRPACPFQARDMCCFSARLALVGLRQGVVNGDTLADVWLYLFGEMRLRLLGERSSNAVSVPCCASMPKTASVNVTLEYPISSGQSRANLGVYTVSPKSVIVTLARSSSMDINSCVHDQ